MNTIVKAVAGVIAAYIENTIVGPFSSMEQSKEDVLLNKRSKDEVRTSFLTLLQQAKKHTSPEWDGYEVKRTHSYSVRNYYLSALPN